MNRVNHLPVLALLVALIACDESSLPAAKTPYGIQVHALLVAGGGFTNVGANSAGAFEILPGALPSGGIKLYFRAPWPSGLKMTIDGAPLPRFEDLAPGDDGAASGYYRIVDTQLTSPDSIWTVAVRPPTAALAAPTYTLAIRNVSRNTQLRGLAAESAPATIVAVPQRTYGLAISLASSRGVASGSVLVTAPGDAPMVCPGECFRDYGQSRTLNLVARPDSGSTFVGWTGPCPPMAPTCAITLNGMSVGVVATFRVTDRNNETAPVNDCPPPNPPPGFMLFATPFCPSQNVFNDPSPDRKCDAQGYFCCAKVADGTGTPRCDANHFEFPASCDFGNPNVRIDPTGCFIR